jgi:hypothetical protein
VSDFDPDRIRARLVEVGEDWADKDAAATLLEETKKTVLAELMLKADGSSAAAKEMNALADPVYRLHVTNMVTARREANKAKIRWETGKTWAELRRSAESTKRAEMNLR